MFTKETEYALRSLVYIQSQNVSGRTPGVVEISREIESPQFFTAKILHRLVKMGFLESHKGKNGGFYFDPGKPDLPLKEFIVAIEGEKLFSGCGFGLKQCDENNPCPLHHHYAPIRDALNELTGSQTIQSLASNALLLKETLGK
ncbi:MAG: RrF2 family transcriptional regulator [Bacteroidota bacterium]